MVNYYLKRTGRAIFTLWLVVTLTFGMIRLLPGGPLTQLRGKLIRQGYPPQQINSIIETYQNLQPDAPLYVQYSDYITALLHGDMGKSFTYPRTVASIVGEALPWTIFVMVTATVIIFAIAIVWGALMAYREGSRFDMGSSVLSIILSSIPFYVLAIALVIVFGYKYSVFPVSYRLSPGVEPGLSLQFVTDALYHAFLPIVSWSFREPDYKRSPCAATVSRCLARTTSVSPASAGFPTVASPCGTSAETPSFRCTPASSPSSVSTSVARSSSNRFSPTLVSVTICSRDCKTAIIR